MRRLLQAAAATYLVLTGSILHAQYDRVLLPITPGSQAGAYGSQWLTTVAITNSSDASITVGGYKEDCGGLVCRDLPNIQPHATVVTSSVYGCSGIQGMFLYVEQGRLNDIGVTLRTRDMSRQNETWGTSIPVVSAGALFDRMFQLVDIPVDDQFRAILRIYDFTPGATGAVRVRIYAVTLSVSGPLPDGRVADRLLNELTPAFTSSSCAGYAEVPLSPQAGLAPGQRLRVEVQPLDGKKDYWGFASVTHNSTQLVTVIQPEQ